MIWGDVPIIFWVDTHMVKKKLGGDLSINKIIQVFYPDIADDFIWIILRNLQDPRFTEPEKNLSV